MSSATYEKTEGTSGIRGQLYETKLLSLILYRAQHDDSIQEFVLASNVADVGAFDDVCFRASVRGRAAPVLVFLQVKHRRNSRHTLDVDLLKYFRSYLKIRERFESDRKVELFQGKYQETECYFVIYTSATDTFASDAARCDSVVHELVDTGGTAKRPYSRRADARLLCDTFLREQIIALAKQMATYMSGGNHVETILSDELMRLYHVVLAQKVLDVSDVKPGGHRVATFRADFFDAKEEHLVLFRDALYKEILKRRTIEPVDMNYFLTEFLAEPTDAKKLSKLIGTVVTYNEGHLEFDELSTNEFMQRLHLVHISRLTADAAVELAAEDVLSMGMKVPAVFGNKDLILSGGEAKQERRLKYLASKLVDLLRNCKSSKIVTIDDSLEKGLLLHNGGLAGAIGNILVPDDDTNLVKFTQNWESLGVLAQKLYRKIIDEIPNLHDYKFRFNVNQFPKLSFDCSECEKNLVADFLDKLVMYSKQADENSVEDILKSKIEEYQCDHPNYFQAKTDAIFLKYHDEIQKWWMQTKQASFLTKDSKIFENAINNIIKDPLMSSINVTYMSTIKHIEYSFTADAVTSLDLQDDRSTTAIVTDNSALTAVKVLQLLKNKEHVVLDLAYIATLPTNDRNALRKELMCTTEAKVLVFICDKIQNSRNEIKTLDIIANAALHKKTIIVTNRAEVKTLRKYFSQADSTVHDERNSLIHMSKESQKTILESARVMFQGVELGLDVIVDDESKAYVRGDVLNEVIREERILVGKLIVNRHYDEIKHLYVDRRIKKNGKEIAVKVKTFYDIADEIVLITSEPGMGKSTLLTHLSLKTKEIKPEVWIVRINLLEYSRVFSKWNEQKTVIDSLEILKFTCHVIVRDKLGAEHNVDIALREENGAVYLKHSTGDQWTEFEMNLFLHYYNKGEIIFLFDGFDEICPHYTKEAIACLKSVTSDLRKHRVWITSRSYNEVKNILLREFGPSYEMDLMSYIETEQYLQMFWEHNLRLQELNSAQLDNVKSFIEYMTQLEYSLERMMSMPQRPLNRVYDHAARYLIGEVEREHSPLSTYTVQHHNSPYLQVSRNVIASLYASGEANRKIFDSRSGSPLYLFLAATYLVENIKRVSESKRSWDLEVQLFHFNCRFLETIMKKIRFQEKNEMNIYNPDVIHTYDKELAHFILRHKKLAAYGFVSQLTYQYEIALNKKDLEEIKETIQLIEKGEEKTGLVHRVHDGVPLFIHNTFVDHLAVEYVCDCLKHDNDSDKITTWIHFIFNGVFTAPFCDHVRTILDYKMSSDVTLMNVVHQHQQLIFDLVMQQGAMLSEHERNQHHDRIEPHTYAGSWALYEVAKGLLPNYMAFIASVLETHINERNLNKFLEIVNDTKLLRFAFDNNGDKFIVFAIDLVTKVDESKLTVLLQHVHRSQHSLFKICYGGESSTERVQRIKYFRSRLCLESISEHLEVNTNAITGDSDGMLRRHSLVCV